MIEISKVHPSVQALLEQHLPVGLHDNLDPNVCSFCCSQQVRAASSADGGVCFACGGLTVRTGTCTTCTSCGTSSGCG